LSLWGKIFGLEKSPDYEEGIRYYNEGKYDLAVESLERAIEKTKRTDPTYALGRFYAAECHAHIGTAKLHAGELEEALSHFEKAVEQNPTYPDIFYRMGVILSKLGRFDEAVEALGRAIELNSSYFEAICYLGIILYENGRVEDADRCFRRAMKIGAENPSPISKFLSEHISGKEVDIPPLKELKELVVSDNEFDSYVKEGIEAFNTGNFEDAVSFFTEAVKIHPNYADLRFKLGLSLLKLGEHAESRKELEKALEINPRYTEARFYLGISYLDEKMYKEALQHFKIAAEERPDYADVQCFLGATYFYLGEIEDAKRVISRSLELSPDYTKAKYYYGLIEYISGEKDKAVEYLSNSIQSGNPKDNATISLALVHLREGNLEEAMAVLHDILKAGGESADVLYFLGDVYLKMDRINEAENFFRKALEINPSFLRASEKLALILLRKGDYAGAEELLSGSEKDFAELYKLLGDIKFFKGDIDDAEKYYRKSLKINSEYSEAALPLALVLRKKERFDEAEDVLKHILDYDPENVVARNLLGKGPLDIQ